MCVVVGYQYVRFLVIGLLYLPNDFVAATAVLCEVDTMEQERLDGAVLY